MYGTLPNQMYSRQNPPVMFTNLDVSQQLAPYVPAMTAELATAMTLNATKNHIRQQHYQTMAMNGWQNPSFQQAVQFSMDMMQLGFNKGFYNDVNAAISRTAIDASLMLCSIFAVSNPQLMQGLPPDIVNSTNQACQAFNSSINEINAFKMQNRQMGIQSGMAGNIGFPQNQMVNTAMIQNPYQTRQMGNNMPGLMPNNNQGQIFSYGATPNQGNTHIGVRPIQANVGIPPALASPIQPQVMTQSVEVQQTAPVVTKLTQAIKEVTVDDWKPFYAQPYLPLINTSFQQLTAKVVTEADTKPIVKVLIEERTSNVDRQAHQIGFIQRTVTDRVDPSYPTRIDANDATLRDIGNTYEKASTASFDKAIEIFSESRTVFGDIVDTDDTNLLSAILRARYFRAAQQKQNKKKEIATAYTVPVAITRTFITDPSNIEMFKEFKHYKNFKAVSQFLKRLLATPASEYSLLENIAQIDHYLTEKLNDLLHNKLGLFNLTSSSFIEDVGDLEEIIKGEGSIYLERYVAAQEHFISLYVSDPIIVQTEVGMGGDEEVEVTSVNFSVTTYITLLGVMENELNVNIPNDKPVAVLAGSHPALYEFISKMLKHAGSNKAGKLAAEYYIVTMDDNIYQIHEGLIGNDFYLISRVN